MPLLAYAGVREGAGHVRGAQRHAAELRGHAVVDASGGGGRVLLTEIPLPRIARQRIACLISIRGQARRARIEKFEFDEGFQSSNPHFRTITTSMITSIIITIILCNITTIIIIMIITIISFIITMLMINHVITVLILFILLSILLQSL